LGTVRKRPPEHLASTVAEAMRRSVVTRNFLKNNLAGRWRASRSSQHWRGKDRSWRTPIGDKSFLSCCAITSTCEGPFSWALRQPPKSIVADRATMLPDSADDTDGVIELSLRLAAARTQAIGSGTTRRQGGVSDDRSSPSTASIHRQFSTLHAVARRLHGCTPVSTSPICLLFAAASKRVVRGLQPFPLP